MSSIDNLLTFEYSDEENYESDTTFNINEAPSGKRPDGDTYRGFYRRLLNTNRGTHTGKWQNKKVLRQKDNERLLDAVISRLELTPFQKSEAKRIFSNIKLNTFGYETEIVAYCVAAVICEQDGRLHECDDLFTQYLEEAEYDPERVKHCLNAVKREVK